MTSSAKIQHRLRATVQVQPRLSLVAALLPGHFDHDSIAVTTATTSSLRGYLVAPSARPVESAPLAQTADPRWASRSLQSLQPCDRIAGSLVFSARSNWVVSDGAIEVVGTATVLDGARRIAAATPTCEAQLLPVVVHFGLTEEQELEIRRGLQTEPSVVESAHTFGTNTPRLVVSDRWVTATIESDPFVVATARGYAPAILLRRPRGPHAEHLLTGAKTLAEKLERIRTSDANGGTLVGTTIRLRKQGTEKTSQYQLEVVD